MPKGSLPRYIVNFEEFVELFPLTPDGSLKPDKAKQRCKGFYIETGNKIVYTETWDITKDIAITGIKLAVTREHEYAMDNFNISISYQGKERKLFESVYVKDVEDYKNMVCFLKVKQNSKLIIEYRNESNVSKDVWFDIDYIAE